MDDKTNPNSNPSPNTNPNPENTAQNTPTQLTAQPVEVASAPAGVGYPQKQPKRKKILLPVLAGVVLLLGGGAAAYNQVVLNSPEKIWEKSLQTTADGLRELVTISEKQNEVKGYTIDGSFRVSEPMVVDGSMTGKVYEMDSVFSGNVGLSGVRLTADVMTKGVEGAAYPDIYMKADGLESVAGLLGFSGQDQQVVDLINEYNDRWFVVDHTLLEEVQNQVTQEIEASSSDEMLTVESGKEIVDTSVPIIEEYLLSADDNKRVFVVDESFGREEFEGADAYKYTVSVNKENLKSFIAAYTDAIKDTEYIKMMLEQSDQSIEEAMELEDLYQEIDDADFSKAKADVWVDAKRKFIRNIRVNMDHDSNQQNYLDIGLPYDGGDELPFTLKAVFNDDDEYSPSSGEMKFVVTYNHKTQDVGLSFALDVDSGGEKVVAEGSLTSKSSDDPVEVDVPSDAMNVLELLGVSNLDQLLNPYGTSNFDDPYLSDDPYYDSLTDEDYLNAINGIQL